MTAKGRSPNDDEIARLRAERDALARQLAELRSSFDKLALAMAGQNEKLDQIVSMLRRREAQLKRAEAEIRKLRRKLGLDDPDPDPEPEPPAGRSTRSRPSDARAPEPAQPVSGSKLPGSSSSASGDADETVTGVAERAGDAPPPPPDLGKKPRPRTRGGRRIPPTHLDADTEYHEACACGRCGGRVFKRDVLETVVYSVVETFVRRRIIRRERVICADPDCHEPTTAPMPPMPCERALYDCRFLAWLVVLKFVLLVPLDRIRTLLLSQGVDIAMGTLVHLIERAADLAGPIDGEHMRQLKAGAYLCFDGTGLKTLVLGEEKAWDGYMEVFTRDHLTVFQFDMTKHADQLRQRINEFLGILVCDAETRNSAANPDLPLANCNAHPLRKLRDAERAQPRLAVQGAKFIQALYDLEDEADLLGLWGPARLAFRQRRSRRVLHRFRQWLEGVLARPLPPSDPVRKVAKYYDKHFDDLTRFLEHAELPLDNNDAEREFQRHAKLRHASLFAGSPEGAHRWATLLGVVRTAQKCDVDVFAYLNWMFERRGSHRRRFAMAAADLTPMAYAAQRPEVRLVV